jgi:hypothetical protein
MSMEGWTIEEINAYRKKRGLLPVANSTPSSKEAVVNSELPEKKVRHMKKAEMSQTEIEYQRDILAGKKAQFEAITLRMANGHRYTPDFFVFNDGVIEMHEVKGSYQLNSEQRAKLAFDQCKVEYPMFKFVWAVKRNGVWDIC